MNQKAKAQVTEVVILVIIALLAVLYFVLSSAKPAPVNLTMPPSISTDFNQNALNEVQQRDKDYPQTSPDNLTKTDPFQ